MGAPVESWQTPYSAVSPAHIAATGIRTGTPRSCPIAPREKEYHRLCRDDPREKHRRGRSGEDSRDDSGGKPLAEKTPENGKSRIRTCTAWANHSLVSLHSNFVDAAQCASMFIPDRTIRVR